MANIYQIAADKIKELFNKQLNETRTGASEPMKTFGTLSKSFKTQITQEGKFTKIELIGAKYGKQLNDGYTTPFKWSGAGANPGSPYIHGLVKWLEKKKGLTGRAALAAAFKIARTAEGKKSPTNPNWIGEIEKPVYDEVTSLFKTHSVLSASQQIHKTLNISI